MCYRRPTLARSRRADIASWLVSPHSGVHVMHTRLWILVAGSVATLSACGGTPSSNASDHSRVEGATTELGSSQSAQPSSADWAAPAHGVIRGHDAQRLAT